MIVWSDFQNDIDVIYIYCFIERTLRLKQVDFLLTMNYNFSVISFAVSVIQCLTLQDACDPINIAKNALYSIKSDIKSVLFPFQFIFYFTNYCIKPYWIKIVKLTLVCITCLMGISIDTFTNGEYIHSFLSLPDFRSVLTRLDP